MTQSKTQSMVDRWIAKGWYTENHFTLYPKLGYKHGQHLPNTNHMHYTTVDGTRYRIDPPTGGKHRVKYQCPVCSKWYGFGRRTQHERACIQQYIKGQSHD